MKERISLLTNLSTFSALSQSDPTSPPLLRLSLMLFVQLFALHAVRTDRGF